MEILHIHIRMDRHGRGHVFIDGEPLRNVTKIGFFAGVDQINRVTLELLIPRVEIEGVAEVTTIEHKTRHHEKAK